MKKIKIVIAGIGGVGGYFGGMLAKKYFNHDEIEIHFLARGKHLQAIQNHGLKIIEGETSFSVHPASATDHASTLGRADYILLCTKTYSLKNTLEQLAPCIDEQTVLLPLLNGVDSVDHIQSIYPQAQAVNGCVYLVAQLKETGVIENSGSIQTLFFGDGKADTRKLVKLELLLRDAQINATYSANILQIIWEKFIFIAPTATATSCFNTSIGAILEQSEKCDALKRLIAEVHQLALAQNIPVDKAIENLTLKKLESLPFATTSSMSRDFTNGKPETELESLTGYVVHLGEKLNSATPTFLSMYQELRKR